MKPLAAHKKLLIAESELNRSILVNDCQQLISGVGAKIEHIKSFGSFFWIAKIFSAGFSAFREKKSEAPPEKRSWMSTLVSGAIKATNLWSSLRARSRQNHE